MGTTREAAEAMVELSSAMGVVWRTIKANPNYKISNNGQVISLHSGKFMAVYKKKNGINVVRLFENGKKHEYCVHRLVAEAFIHNTYHCKQVTHIDGNKDNNDFRNLEWKIPKAWKDN